jgi:ion channel-forming bestrophin family protein
MIVLPRRTWIRDIFTYRGTVLPRIWRRLLFIAGLSVLLTVGHLELGLFVPKDITTLPFTLTGFALSVFLGFRTTTAYNRYWEGRTLWGALINTERSFTRQVLHWIGPNAGTTLDDRQSAALAARRSALVHLAVGFAHALRLRLRDQDDVAALARFAAADDLPHLEADNNRPQWFIHRITAELRRLLDEGLIHPQHVTFFDASLTAMTDIQGACERIRNTPLPYVYAVLVHQIVGFYCVALPWGLLHTLQWIMPAVAVLVSYAFFGLDVIGEELDNPFDTDANDLPLASLCTAIEIDQRARLGEQDLPPFAQPHNGLLL